MTFDPAAREAELVAEAGRWNTSNPIAAEPGDIPIVDLGPFRASGTRADLNAAAHAVRTACEQVGFFQLVGHGLSADAVADIFEQTRRFHSLPEHVKHDVHIDNPSWPLSGVGWLPFGQRRLPRRELGNENVAFLIKSDATISSSDNQWLDDAVLPGFRAAVEKYADKIEAVAMTLVRVYAVALDLDPDWFDEAFAEPFWRLRLTQYPPQTDPATEAFGIAPHVDTTFFTLLVQDAPGLTIHHAQRNQWLHVPVIEDAIVVNTGELLRQWSNDRFLSTRHFANNTSTGLRHSVPLFFNASGDWPMECIPTCWGPDNPPRYPPVSYNQSQAVAQGE